MGTPGRPLVSRGGIALRLLYHRGLSYSDPDLADYVYLRNLLTEASEKVAPDIGAIELLVDTRAPFWHAVERAKVLGKKGLPTPRDAFAKGGDGLGTSLLLYRDGERQLEYFWHGRDEVEKALEALRAEGAGWLARYL